MFLTKHLNFTFYPLMQVHFTHVFFQISVEDLKNNKITATPCGDVDHNDAVNVSIDELIVKNSAENDFTHQILQINKDIKKCRLFVDQSNEASKCKTTQKSYKSIEFF